MLWASSSLSGRRGIFNGNPLGHLPLLLMLTLPLLLLFPVPPVPLPPPSPVPLSPIPVPSKPSSPPPMPMSLSTIPVVAPLSSFVGSSRRSSLIVSRLIITTKHR